ncbi:MAG: 4Fe-4S dicluster domain-containing protein [Rhodospirillaceae bacterium]|jgi:tetrathionate reductase subunit B|nr:4Fe-4S dicluster domain-containing protein [Rhodospirillaceae bacterium]MBT6138584.1 4Fe-4S dicluster domain-containing protein [Rhodospirillaceae bacterium]
MTLDPKPDHSRRGFLGAALTLTAGLAIVPGVILFEVAKPKAAQPSTAGVTSKVRWGLLIDTNKCEPGCDACVTACKTEHGWEGHGRPRTDPQWIRKIDIRDPKFGTERSLPVMCQHCAEPPCVDVCPTGASFKRADGIVLVDKHTCIGCRYCMMACPYKARSFVHEAQEDQKTHSPRGKGTVEGCNLCVHRVDRGGTPACVEACAAEAKGAIVFGDLNDPKSDISKRLARYPATRLRADLGTDNGVAYQGL